MKKACLKNQRRCGPTASDVRWQMLVIKGKNFASSENAPAKFISITAKRRKCDCPRNQPCMNVNTYICSAGPCPSGTTTVDCNNPAEANKYDGHEVTLASCPSAGSEEDTNKCLSFTHYHDEIWVKSIPGFGRNITLGISIGGKLIGTNSYQYKKPIVLAVAPYRAGDNNNNNDNDDVNIGTGGSNAFYDAKGGNIIFVGRNFGYPLDISSSNYTRYIKIFIGHEYDRNGERCIGDGCMKECEHVKWFAALNENVASASGLSDLYLGHPYIIYAKSKCCRWKKYYNIYIWTN